MQTPARATLPAIDPSFSVPASFGPACGQAGGPGVVLGLLAALGLVGAVVAGERDAVAPWEFTGELLGTWSFDSGEDHWRAQHDCRLEARQGVLVVESTGEDPYLVAPADATMPRLLLCLRARFGTSGPAQVFWTTSSEPAPAEARSRHFRIEAGDAWREYEVPLEVEGRLTGLRLDPGSGPGKVEIDWIALRRRGVHPLWIERAEVGAAGARIIVASASAVPIDFRCRGRAARIEGPGTISLPLPEAGGLPIEEQDVELEIPGSPGLRRRVVLVWPEAPGDFLELGRGDLRLRAARDGSVAFLERAGRLAAALAPLVSSDGRVLRPALAAQDGARLTFEGEGVFASLELLDVTPRHAELRVKIRSLVDRRDVEGPVVRVPGALEQGLLSGVEYLGKGERSSSRLDIETEDHLRAAPDPIRVTSPLMACVTRNDAVALTWQDTSLRPVFASPDFIDFGADHRLALRGQGIDAVLHLLPGSLEDVVEHAIEARGGWPPLPAAPRSPEEQRLLCLRALEGPLAGAGGWGHCAEERFARHRYADMASTLFRLTGAVPVLEGALVPGGSHVRNDAIYFLTGKVAEWLDLRRAEARSLIARQRPDGSFEYRGPYLRGHFEDTASGYCALPAATLLELAHLTGDREALSAGLRTLESLKRFRTPRGAQTWELSLHTPDILASAHLVKAYVLGYKLTGDPELLRVARRWAFTGVPFVYLWSLHPVMAYATTPVLGATNYSAPCWIGLPVQWCGVVYAHALASLAREDATIDWRHLARGILRAAEQMQYPAGPLAGCLPDFFELSPQKPGGPSINPCALVSLSLALDGKVDSLAVAAGNGHRITAPFPVRVDATGAVIKAPPGTRYQVLIDGRRIVEITSRGEDHVRLEE